MIACRVLHIAATCTSLAGLFYARMVLLPTLESLPEADREPFLKQAIRRFAYIKWIGVAVVAATGIYQWFVIWPHVTDHRLYVVYFVIKMLGAFGLFGITFMLAIDFGPMSARRRFWSGLNIGCGMLILIGAGLMRSVARI